VAKKVIIHFACVALLQLTGDSSGDGDDDDSRLGLIIGLSVGLVVALAFVIGKLAVIFCDSYCTAQMWRLYYTVSIYAP